MIVSGTSQVTFEAVKDDECPITLTPINELADPVQVLPCRHIFDRQSILNWVNQNNQNPVCPNDRRNIESLMHVKLVEKIESSVDKNQEQHPGIPDSLPMQDADCEKIKALKMLEGSLVVYQAATKNFVNRAEQIQVIPRTTEEKDRLTESVAFRGAPIDQRYAEYWKQPFPLAKAAQAEVTVTKWVNPDGSCSGEGFRIHILNQPGLF